MPELPEVETIRCGLERHLVGRRVEGIAVYSAHVLDGARASDLQEALVGRRALAVGRRGKYLLCEFEGPHRLIVHLRMTGRLLVVAEAAVSAGSTRHLHLVLHLEGGCALCFHDVRKFGRVYLDRVPDGLRRLGPEPLDAGFTPPRLRDILRGRRTSVKAVLLDQRAIAGLGNIYADEALFRAGIHPARRADRLAARQVTALWRAIREVLADSLEFHGTTFSDYRDLFGEPGRFAQFLRVYARKGESCRACGQVIDTIRVAGRTSHYCPRCQPAPRRPAARRPGAAGRTAKPAPARPLAPRESAATRRAAKVGG